MKDGAVHYLAKPLDLDEVPPLGPRGSWAFHARSNLKRNRHSLGRRPPETRAWRCHVFLKTPHEAEPAPAAPETEASCRG
jgi:hypothetical protein